MNALDTTLLAPAQMEAQERMEQQFTFPDGEVVPQPRVGLRTRVARTLVRLAVRLEPELSSGAFMLPRVP